MDEMNLQTGSLADQLVDAFSDILTLSDEVIEHSKDEIYAAISSFLIGSEGRATIDQTVNEMIRDKLTIDEARDNMEGGKEAIKAILVAVRAQTDSHAKMELLDKLEHSLLNFFDVVLEEYEKKLACVKYEGDDELVPSYANPTDACADIRSNENVIVAPHTYGNLIHTGIKVAIPTGWSLKIYPRSGLSKKTTLRLSNSVGVIDSGYRGEIGILFDNIGDEPVTISRGDRIAQCELQPVHHISFEQIDDITSIEGDRGGGFGHTGVN